MADTSDRRDQVLWLASLVGAAILLWSCQVNSGAHHATGTAGSSRMPGSLPAWVPPDCVGSAASAQPETTMGLHEVQGVASTGNQLWMLVDGIGPPLRTNTPTKLLWRMTGNGPLTIFADGPQREQIRPAWGPVPHGGSSWTRPGDEWGTEFNMPRPGCWVLHAMRSDVTGQVSVWTV